MLKQACQRSDLSSKELIKAEIDDVGDEYLDALLKIIKAFSKPSNTDKNDWHDFIEKFSGCLSEHPIERGSQGNYELRVEIL
jgi:hypothetical protein